MSTTGVTPSIAPSKGDAAFMGSRGAYGCGASLSASPMLKTPRPSSSGFVERATPRMRAVLAGMGVCVSELAGTAGDAYLVVFHVTSVVGVGVGGGDYRPSPPPGEKEQETQ